MDGKWIDKQLDDGKWIDKQLDGDIDKTCR